MERLTERVGEFIRIKGCKTLYASEERKGAYLYNAIVRLAKYEDMVPMPEPNKPLTLEELQGMDGEPIWYKNKNGAEWCIIRVINGQFFAQSGGSNNCAVNCDTYGKTWLAYRRPPEQ